MFPPFAAGGSDLVYSRALASLLAVCALAFGTLSGREDPSPTWTFATGGPIFSSPSAADGVIYIGSDDRHLYALDARTGDLVWKQALAAPVRSRPLVDGGSVVVVAGNDAVALSRADGSVRWRFDAPAAGAAPLDRWDYHQSSPVRGGAFVYFGGGNGEFHGLAADTGEVRFSFSTEDGAPIRSTPAVAAGTVYFGDWNGIIYALDAQTGELRWKHATLAGPKPYPQFGGAVSAMLAADGRLYFGLRNPDVFALDAATGRVLWTFTAADGSWVPGTPVLAEGMLYITGSDDHRVHALEAKTGARRWSCDVGLNMFLAPLVVGNRVIVGDANSYAEDAGQGHLHVIDRSDGRLVRSMRIGGNAGASSPILAGGRIVIGSEDGRVLAYELAHVLD